MEKQLVQFKFPGMTEKQYDQVMDELRRTGQQSPAGRIHHVSSFQNDNCLVLGVWESREAFDTFNMNVLKPLLSKLGIRQAQPTISSVYYEYSGVEEHASH
ncbi:MAG TPA: hypothetical protein VGK10_00680 [Prolixibacteraceae bacterium]|jgi:hypothetical protein